MIKFYRRHLFVSAAAMVASSVFDRAARAQAPATFAYRGFTVDTTEAQSAPNLSDVEKSLKHQIDITADCGATPKIIDFFESQTIFVKPGQGDGGGRFSSKVKGVAVDVAIQGPRSPWCFTRCCTPIIGGCCLTASRTPRSSNSTSAPGRRLLPAGRLRAQERAGVLCGHRQPLSLGQCRPPPHDRKTLHDKQPVYYQWLGDQFGVVKTV